MKIQEKDLGFIMLHSMYTVDCRPFSNKYENYILVNGKKKYVNGNQFYRRSPYKINHITNEKRFLIQIGEEDYHYFPAIKIGEKYLNLISKKELSIEDLNKVDEIEYMFVSFSFENFYDL